MTGYKYSTKLEENTAKAISHNLSISTKISGQVCKFVKNMTVEKAKAALIEVIAKKRAVPMKRHFKETAHKRGMAVGRYPVKAAAKILAVIQSAEANAQYKGLSSANLIVKHAVAQKGPSTRAQGRTGGMSKRTHIEVVLHEKKIVKKAEKSEVKKAPVTPKPKVKKEEPKIEERKTSPSAEQAAPQEKKKDEGEAKLKVEEKKETPKVEEKKESPKVEEKPKEEAKPEPKEETQAKTESPKPTEERKE